MYIQLYLFRILIPKYSKDKALRPVCITSVFYFNVKLYSSTKQTQQVIHLQKKLKYGDCRRFLPNSKHYGCVRICALGENARPVRSPLCAIYPNTDLGCVRKMPSLCAVLSRIRFYCPVCSVLYFRMRPLIRRAHKDNSSVSI